MNPATVATVIEAIANIITTVAPIAIKAEQNIQPFAVEIYQLATGKQITDDDITASLTRVNALSAKIQSSDFIPPKQDDDV